VSSSVFVARSGADCTREVTSEVTYKRVARPILPCNMIARSAPRDLRALRPSVTTVRVVGSPALSSCPPDEELLAWAHAAHDRVDGLPSDIDLTSERSHLTECSACLRLVTELVVDLRGGSPADPRLAKNELSLQSAPTELAPLTREAIADTPWTKGEVLDERYQVVGLLGRGGMGVVLRVVDLHSPVRSDYAMKILHRSLVGSEVVVRLEREACMLRELPELAVSAPIRLGALQSGEPYMVMVCLDGRDLSTVLRQGGRLPPDAALAYFEAIVLALELAHRQRIVHRDLKPSNIFVQRDGSLRLLDFGLSKWTARDLHDGRLESLTQANAIMGTPAYMAPEQIRDPRLALPSTDVWAVGVVLLEMLTGTNPFVRGTLGSTLAAVLTEPWDTQFLLLQDELRGRHQSDLRAAAKVLACCLAKESKHRYGDASELASAFKTARSEKASRAVVDGNGGLSRKWLHAGAAITMSAAVLGAFRHYRATPEPPLSHLMASAAASAPPLPSLEAAATSLVPTSTNLTVSLTASPTARAESSVPATPVGRRSHLPHATTASALAAVSAPTVSSAPELGVEPTGIQEVAPSPPTSDMDPRKKLFGARK
jgi:eukaryotic-like serine/threonine-protein kinase